MAFSLIAKQGVEAGLRGRIGPDSLAGSPKVKFKKHFFFQSDRPILQIITVITGLQSPTENTF